MCHGLSHKDNVAERQKGLSEGHGPDSPCHIYLQNRSRRNVRKSGFRRPFLSRKALTAYQEAPLTPSKGGAWDAGRALRLSISEKVDEFLIAILRSKSVIRRATGPLLHRNEHAVMLQRGRRCKAIAAPLQPRGALTGSPSSPFGGVRGGRMFVNACLPAVCKSHRFSPEKTARF